MTRQPGFSLIEVMVALLVLSLGLVGGMGMQLAALRTRHQSALLSQAVTLAAGMADRMRANSGQMNAADSLNPYLNQFYDTDTDGAPAPSSVSCFAAAGCTGAQLAAFDLLELKRQLGALLPAGRLAICRDTPAWDEAGRGLRWECHPGAGAPVVIKLGWRGKNPDGTPLQDGPGADLPAVAVTLAGAVR
jgi:type IV pilus assembly protein PilV